MAVTKRYSHGKKKGNYIALVRSLEKDWQSLCSHYLPMSRTDSIWRYSRGTIPDGMEQGWKIHISATILSASRILKNVAPLLCSTGTLFKAPISLHELSKINSGLHYGFSQIGKFITVYPRNPNEAVSLAQKLHRLTCQMSGPIVPYDLPFHSGSCIYYRYGSFASSSITKPDGTLIPALKKPNGKLIPDHRKPGMAAPGWVPNPFPESPKVLKTGQVTPLKTTIRAYKAISQRGKGGVYRALDLSVLPARLCILKEGRKHGETDWGGRDGSWRVRHEEQVLHELFSASVPVPAVYTSFWIKSYYYLVTEFIEGTNLQSLVTRKSKRLSVRRALKYGLQLSVILSKIHQMGWVWRDCKPLNLILSKDGVLRPLDFEGACRSNLPDPMPWGTTGYAPPEYLKEPATGSRIPEDLYALGSTLCQLLIGETLRTATPASLKRELGQRVETALVEVISALLDPEPLSRPDAQTTSQILRMIYPD